MTEELDCIPKDETELFPDWVSEKICKTQAEIHAFIDGITYVNDADVFVGTPFERDGEWVVRIATSEDFDPDQIDEMYF